LQTCDPEKIKEKLRQTPNREVHTADIHRWDQPKKRRRTKPPGSAKAAKQARRTNQAGPGPSGAKQTPHRITVSSNSSSSSSSSSGSGDSTSSGSSHSGSSDNSDNDTEVKEEARVVMVVDETVEVSGPLEHMWHLKRVPQECRATCHGVSREGERQKSTKTHKQERCKKQVKKGTVQPCFAGKITTGAASNGGWDVVNGIVYFCANPDCVSKRHQWQGSKESQKSGKVPTNWPVAYGTDISEIERQALLNAGFVPQMKTSMAQPGVPGSAVIPDKRWGAVVKRLDQSTPEPVMMLNTMKAAQKFIAMGNYKLEQTLVDVPHQRTWSLSVKPDKKTPWTTHKVTFSQEPSCSCRRWTELADKLKAGRRVQYHSCVHLKICMWALLNIPFTAQIIDAPTLSKQEVKDSLKKDRNNKKKKD
jgi:hypothetical protein